MRLALTWLVCLTTGCMGLNGSSSAGGSAQATYQYKSASACVAATPALVSNPEINHLPTQSACQPGCDTPAPRQLRRLTLAELNATLSTLFNNEPAAPLVTAIFANDPEIYAFGNVATGLQIDQIGALQTRAMAEMAGNYAAIHASTLWPSCSDTSTACEQSFVQGFGLRAFRAPLDAATSADFLALMQSQPSFADGVAAVTTAMLMSPQFLFRQELGVQAPDGYYDLTPFEVAGELSYLIVGSMPDAQLFAAAQDGSILDPAVRLNHARRLMQDTRAHAVVDGFFLQWLGVASLPTVTRSQGNVTMDPCIAARMVAETTQTIDNVVFAENGSFADLHSTNYTFTDSTLAAFYGMGGGGATMAMTPLNGQRDPGILNQGGVLAAASEVNMPSPVLRGRMLREHILCQPIPPPPAGVPAVANIPTGSTTRDVFAAHITNATCNSCHTLMDPMAYAFGGYDTLGRRFVGNMENGEAINTQATINDLPNGQSVTLSGAAAMSAFIATSAQAQSCLARNWAMYGLGNISWLQDGCTYTSLDALATGNGYNLQATLMALTRVTSFVRRTQDQ